MLSRGLRDPTDALATKGREDPLAWTVFRAPQDSRVRKVRGQGVTVILEF